MYNNKLSYTAITQPNGVTEEESDCDDNDTIDEGSVGENESELVHDYGCTSDAV